MGIVDHLEASGAAVRGLVGMGIVDHLEAYGAAVRGLVPALSSSCSFRHHDVPVVAAGRLPPQQAELSLVSVDGGCVVSLPQLELDAGPAALSAKALDGRLVPFRENDEVWYRSQVQSKDRCDGGLQGVAAAGAQIVLIHLARQIGVL